MKKKAIILTGILSVVIILSMFVAHGTAEERIQGVFSSDKSVKSLVKDVIVGQREIKAMLQQLNKKIDSASICK